MRFGRIPKREKQRLLDEMQSYMNSLSQSASMEMEVSSPPGTPRSPHTLQPYGSDEKPLKMAAVGSGPAPSFPGAEAQDASRTPSYHVPASFPAVSSSDDSSSDADKFTLSSKPGQCPVTGHVSTPTFRNSVPSGDFQNQTSCPWKLSGGAKVLVSLYFESFCSDAVRVSVSTRR